MNKLNPFVQKRKLWQWFREHQAEFENTDPTDPIYNAFYEKLSVVHPSLVFEISPKDKSNIRTLVISCDGILEGIPAVEELVSKAPTIEGWKIVAFRQPIKESITLEMDNLKLSTDDIMFDYQAAPDDMIDITLYVNKVNETNKEDYLRAAFILLDAAIGEYLAMTKIRHLEIMPMPSDINSLRPLLSLVDTMNGSDRYA